MTENAALGGRRDKQQEAEEERGWREARRRCAFHPEVMSCQSDNKLQMEAGAFTFSPTPVCVRGSGCVCARAQGRASGIYVLTFLPLGCGLARRVIKTQSEGRGRQ